MDKTKKPAQIDFLKYYTPTDFDSPEVVEEMKKIKQEIEKVMEGAKIDPTKMNTIFNMQAAAKGFCQTAFPKVGFWTFPSHIDLFRAGILYGCIAIVNQKSETQQPMP